MGDTPPAPAAGERAGDAPEAVAAPGGDLRMPCDHPRRFAFGNVAPLCVDCLLEQKAAAESRAAEAQGKLTKREEHIRVLVQQRDEAESRAAELERERDTARDLYETLKRVVFKDVEELAAERDALAERLAAVETEARRLESVERDYRDQCAILATLQQRADEMFGWLEPREPLLRQIERGQAHLQERLAELREAYDWTAKNVFVLRQQRDGLAAALAQREAEVATVREETRRACAEELRNVSKGDLAGWVKQLDGLVRRWAPSVPGEDATPAPGGKGE